MKRFLGRKKKKVKNDADLSYYRPPSVQESKNADAAAPAAATNDAAQHPDLSIDRSSATSSSAPPPPPPVSPAADDGAASDASSDVTHGYRSALAAYADTIDPAFSNEDGLGGGGGTLRSRSGRVRGSAGSRHRSLIPVFEDSRSSVGGGGSGAASSAGGAVAAALSPVSFASGTTTGSSLGARYEGLMQGRGSGATTATAGERGKDGEEGGTWAPIPEQPRSAGSELGGGSRGESIVSRLPSTNTTTTIDPSRSNSQQSANTRSLMDEVLSQREESPEAAMMDLAGQLQQQNPSSRNVVNVDISSRARSAEDQNDATFARLSENPSRSMSPHTAASSTYGRDHYPMPLHAGIPSNSTTLALAPSGVTGVGNRGEQPIMLQPDAIYEEHYGDAYVDGLITYLYPAGYQSMRPRSGPWKLSIFIFLLFMWLSVFIVGHCYDRGRREYNYYFDNVDDNYLEMLDDDMLVMETRWCGSKLLYFMWMVSVWITVLSMSYCSIIGYVKVRDVAVANGRSQPPGMGAAAERGGNGGGRSDYYVTVENVSNSNMGAMAGSNASEGGGEFGRESGYSSYQDGGCRGRHRPSIYQSDGTPQFWGGHIYRPTQAAVAMTNRP